MIQLGLMRPICDFLDYSDRDDLLAGGVRMLPVKTPVGAFKVWTKRIGNNPTLTCASAARWPWSHPRVPRGL